MSDEGQVCRHCGRPESTHSRSLWLSGSDRRTVMAGTLKIFYVYMHNNTDSRDDEVYKVEARDKKHARAVADDKQDWRNRFSVGFVMGAREKGLKDYKWWATDKTK